MTPIPDVVAPPAGESVDREGAEPVPPARGLETRSLAYRMLARSLLVPPDAGYTAELRDRGLALLREVVPTATSVADQVSSIVESLGDPPRVEPLQVDFTRLMRGLRRRGGPPPPYESVYRGESGLRGDTARVVSEAYARAGIAIAGEFRSELPDHAGIELEFLGMLCELEAQTVRAGDGERAAQLKATRAAFAADHLLRWLPQLRSQVAQSDGRGFYSCLLDIAERLARSELLGLEGGPARTAPPLPGADSDPPGRP